MTGIYKISGMTLSRTFTLHTDKGAIFWATSELTDEKFKELFNWAKADDDFWKQDIKGEVEYETISEVDSVPIKGVVKRIIIDGVKSDYRCAN